MASSWWKRHTQNDESKDSSSTPTADAPSQDETTELKRIYVRFVGEVQCVGFRWTSMSVARELGLTGWVKNEDDGSVVAELQGKPEHVGAFFSYMIAAYRQHPIEYTIDEREEIPVVENETEFTVRY